MLIVVGSTNKAKINAVKAVFHEAEVISLKAPSKVSNQPFSDIETFQGAIERAKFAQQAKRHKNREVFGIGLEGGIMRLKNRYYLCNWGALAINAEIIFDASGVRIPLPKKVIKQLKCGRELGDIMAEMTQDHHIRQKMGAIGVLTNDTLSREDIYIHIVQLLKGQYEYFLRTFN